MFTKCTGTFNYNTDSLKDLLENTANVEAKEAKDSEDNLEHSLQVAEDLHCVFHNCRIEQLFSDYRNIYRELINGKITKEDVS